MGETDKQPGSGRFLYDYLLGCGIPLAIAGAFLIAGVVFLGILFADETLVTRIANYEEWLEKDGETWLEISMPSSLRDLCEVHNIDSNLIYARFYIAPEDIDRLGTGFTEITQQNTPTWPPAKRIFIREKFPCPACDVVQHRLVVDIKTGLVEFNPENSDAFSWVGNPCSTF